MAAVLTASAGQIEDVAKSVAECGRLGVAVLPADVNRSQIGYDRAPAGWAAARVRNRQAFASDSRQQMSAKGRWV